MAYYATNDTNFVPGKKKDPAIKSQLENLTGHWEKGSQGIPTSLLLGYENRMGSLRQGCNLNAIFSTKTKISPKIVSLFDFGKS